MIAMTRESSGLDGHIRSLVLSGMVTSGACVVASRFTNIGVANAGVFGLCYAGIDFIASYITESLVDQSFVDNIERYALTLLRNCMSIYLAVKASSMLGYSVTVFETVALAKVGAISILAIASILIFTGAFCVYYIGNE